jgi:uncharacterized protein YjbJ (UPF0337 family)
MNMPEEPSRFKQEVTDAVDDAKGLLKEAAGHLSGRDDLAEEGKSEQTKAPLRADDYQPTANTTRGGGRVSGEDSGREL